MNDSFLDEVEIIHSEDLPNIGQRQIEQFITTRKSRSTGALVKSNDLEVLEECQENIDTNTNMVHPKEFKRREFINDQKEKITKQQDLKKHIDQEKKAQILESKILDKRVKLVEKKVKPTETARAKSEELKARHHEMKIKVSDAKHISKEYNRRSGSSTPSSKISDLCSKENNVLSDNITPNRNPSVSKKAEPKDSLALLSAVKELISTYSKQESSKILRAMQELHINSQANLIKHLLIQTEDLTKEIHPSRDTSRLRKLVEDNERMREDIIVLKLRNEELQRRVDESILIKEENVALKLKIKELLKSGS